MSDAIAANLDQVQQRIARAAADAGRPADAVRLIAVSKTVPAEAVRAAFAAGARAFGENYVQELVEKADSLSGLAIEWHFIGPLQSNKTRAVAERAHWVHSIDRLKIAERLAEQRPPGLPALNVCVQVNVSGETSKSGVPLEQAEALARAVAALPNLQLRGLMCIPEPTQDTARLAGQFAQLRALKDRLNAGGLRLDTLSMGMSRDLELAVAEGATMVRVGTAIFGTRDYSI